jgi:hypothetical protein
MALERERHGAEGRHGRHGAHARGIRAGRRLRCGLRGAVARMLLVPICAKVLQVH